MIISLVFAIFILVGAVVGFMCAGEEDTGGAKVPLSEQLGYSVLGVCIGTVAAGLSVLLFIYAPIVLAAIIIAGVIIAKAIHSRKLVIEAKEAENKKRFQEHSELYYVTFAEPKR
jgi:hypothetical protein